MNQTRSMLQSETEYIDARPHQRASTKASCTARPDHTLGHSRHFDRGSATSDLPPISGQFQRRSAIRKKECIFKPPIHPTPLREYALVDSNPDQAGLSI